MPTATFEEVFGSVEGCVTTLSEEDGVEDPAPLCDWLQDGGYNIVVGVPPSSLAECDGPQSIPGLDTS
jgi:hypothetical protein